MTCSNHPDVPALDQCRVCGRALCQLCVYFGAGQVFCADHVDGAGDAVAPVAPLVPPIPAQPDGTVITSASQRIGRSVAAPSTSITEDGAAVTDHGPRTTSHGPPATDYAPTWAADLRLEPLPMSMRPGWTDEPLEARPNTTAETLGIAGLVVSLISLPFNLCCGIGGVIAVPLALVGGGCGIAALVLAPKARNPSTARWTGGFGLVLALLSLAVLACYLAFTASMMSGLIFSGLLPTPFVYGTPTP